MRELIQIKYSGQYDQTFDFVDIGIQTVAVLIGGIVLWRAVVIYQRRLQNNRKRNSYFDSKYSNHWKK